MPHHGCVTKLDLMYSSYVQIKKISLDFVLFLHYGTILPTWHLCCHGWWCGIMSPCGTLRWCHINPLTTLALPHQHLLPPLPLFYKLNDIFGPTVPRCPPDTFLTTDGTWVPPLLSEFNVENVHEMWGWVGSIPHPFSSGTHNLHTPISNNGYQGTINDPQRFHTINFREG
jgi:hypothetical protein